MRIEEHQKKIESIFDEFETVSNSKYPLMSLKEICKQLTAGGDVPKSNWSKDKTNEYTVPIYSNGTADNALYGYTNIKRVEEDAVSISARGTIGYTAIRKAPFYPIVRLIVAVPDTDKVLLSFLAKVVSRIDFKKSGKTIPQLTVPMIKDIKIPIPPIEEQNSAMKKVEKYESEISALQSRLSELSNIKNKILEKHL